VSKKKGNNNKEKAEVTVPEITTVEETEKMLTSKFSGVGAVALRNLQSVAPVFLQHKEIKKTLDRVMLDGKNNKIKFSTVCNHPLEDDEDINSKCKVCTLVDRLVAESKLKYKKELEDEASNTSGGKGECSTPIKS